MNQESLSDLCRALTQGTPEEVEKLLRNGADPNQLCDDEKLLGAYIIKIHGIENKTHFYENIHLLLKYGADPNGTFKESFFSIQEQDTFLHALCRFSDRVEIAKLLLFYGAYLYKKNNNGHTPLLAAVKANSYESVELLVTWPYDLVKASETNSLLAKLLVFCTLREKENIYVLLLVLNRKKIKLHKPILVRIIEFIMEDSEKRIQNNLAQMIWNSDDSKKTAQEVVEKMLQKPFVNNQTALSVASQLLHVSMLKVEREKIKKLLGMCIEIEK